MHNLQPSLHVLSLPFDSVVYQYDQSFQFPHRRATTIRNQPHMLLDREADRQDANSVWTLMPGLLEGTSNLIEHIGVRLQRLDHSRSSEPFVAWVLRQAVSDFTLIHSEYGRSVAERAYLSAMYKGLIELRSKRICARRSKLISARREDQYIWQMQQESLEVWASRFAGWHIWITHATPAPHDIACFEVRGLLSRIFGSRAATLVETDAMSS